jgi:leucyl/phenylalanyl-tRNA--protein transferase
MAMTTPQPLPPCPYRFPDPRGADVHGLVCEGGDLEPSTIVAAYRAGIFPWPHEDRELLWFSPDPRAILPLDGLHISRRLARTLRVGRYQATVDTAFREVIAACADRPDGGTWITPNMVAAYTRLHELGWAHSIETWTADGTLAGGLYGLRVGRLFGAESMFHRATDASKVAMVRLVSWALETGITLIDVQLLTPHLASMGAVEISREEYLRMVAGATA